jgi:hypothetical protein
MSLFEKVVFSLLGVLFLFLLVTHLHSIQKINNYDRCKSVVNMAKKTGKLVTDKSTHEICKYHLE